MLCYDSVYRFTQDTSVVKWNQEVTDGIQLDSKATTWIWQLLWKKNDCSQIQKLHDPGQVCEALPKTFWTGARPWSLAAPKICPCSGIGRRNISSQWRLWRMMLMTVSPWTSWMIPVFVWQHVHAPTCEKGPFQMQGHHRLQTHSTR